MPCVYFVQSLDEMAEQLQVSKASVSANARLLETIGMIERVTKPGDRRDYYAATSPDVHRRLESFCAFFDHLTASMQQIRDGWNGVSHGVPVRGEEDR
jgi:DNA-binding transcriptional regulator GbsR (MarR family)